MPIFLDCNLRRHPRHFSICIGECKKITSETLIRRGHLQPCCLWDWNTSYSVPQKAGEFWIIQNYNLEKNSQFPRIKHNDKHPLYTFRSSSTDTMVSISNFLNDLVSQRYSSILGVNFIQQPQMLHDSYNSFFFHMIKNCTSNASYLHN